MEAEDIKHQVIRFNKNQTALILFIIYSLALVIPPYWSIKPATLSGKLFFLLLTLGIGYVWAYASSDSFSIMISKSDRYNYSALAFFSLIVFALNYPALTSAIPWRGDEDYHIEVLLKLTALPAVYHLGKLLTVAYAPLLILVSFFAVMLVYSIKRGARSAPAWFLIVLAFPVALILHNPTAEYHLLFLRYPFLSRYLQIIPLGLAKLFDLQYSEFAYRIYPLACVIALCWSSRRMITAGTALRFLWCAALATMPLIYYYTSILYVEMLAVLLMILMMFDIKNLLTSDWDSLKKNPGWYALIIIGFIKETVFPFLGAFIAVRGGYAAYGFFKGRLSFRAMLNEIKTAFCVCAPLCVYVFYRSQANSRKYTSDVFALSNMKPYAVWAHSFFEQFGLFFILFAAGLLILLKKREYLTTLFLIAVFTFISVFHSLDLGGQYAGYSRFCLFLLPALICGAAAAVNSICSKRRYLAYTVLFLVVLVNLFLTPINSDGTKKPRWGNILYDTSEHYYPYREALLWIKENFKDDKICVAGMDNAYYFDFYFQKFNWHPKCKVEYKSYGDNREAVMRVLKQCALDNYAVVIFHAHNYHVSGPRYDISSYEDTNRIYRRKIFENKAHKLTVYYKPKDGVI